MNYKKIFCIVLIAVLAVIVIGTVQAADSGATKTKIRGIDFNIPAGYTECSNSDRDNTSLSGVISDMILYENKTGDIFIITVMEFDHNVSPSLIEDDGNPVTIKNVDGRLENASDGDVRFNFIKDGKYLIMIRASDKNIIEEILP